MPLVGSERIAPRLSFRLLCWLPVLIAIWLTATVARGDTVYQTVDDAGIPSFSDQAVPGARAVEVQAASAAGIELPQGRQQSPDAGEVTPLPRRGQHHVKADIAATAKAPMTHAAGITATIAHPSGNSTIRDNAGNLSLLVAITPVLHAGHKAELIMDGQVVKTLGNLSGKETPVSLNNIDRGTHQFAIRIRDGNHREIYSSPAKKITILRVSRRQLAPK